MKAKTIALIAVGGVLALLAAVFIAGRLRHASRDTATARFKELAIAEITKLAADPNATSNQVVSMARLTDEEDRWFSPHLIAMKNGEWVVYSNKCNKEDPGIRDTFVCRASDGKWYESTFHFCKGAIVLRMEGQPDDLRSFATRYKLTPLLAIYAGQKPGPNPN